MSTLAEAAHALVGTPFRLHGRDPATGLDCLGVLHAALADIGRTPALPNSYTLRNRVLPDLDHWATRCGLVPASGPIRSGDVLILRVSTMQHHLVIALTAGIVVHAHAGLRRVVTGPIPADWTVSRHWRLPYSE